MTTSATSFLRHLAENDDLSASKLTKVVVTMLPFQLKVNISDGKKDRLLFQEVEDEDNEVHRRAVQDVDLSILKSRMTSYLNDVFEESLDASSSVFSPFSTTVLTLTSYSTDFGTRKLGEMLPVLGEEDQEEINVEDLEWEVLEEVDLDAILDRKEAELENAKEEETELSMEVARKTAAAQTVTATFTSVAIFTKDGDLPVPDNNQVAAIQIGAFQEGKKPDMLAALQGANDATEDENDLLQYAKTATATIYAGDGNSNNASPNTDTNPNSINTSNNNDQGLDTVILIAVIVAAMSLFLLAIGIFIAWRRKVKTQTHYRSHSHNHHYTTSSSTAKNVTNEATIPPTVHSVKKSKRRSGEGKEQAGGAHAVPPSESDLSVSDLGTSTTNVDPPMMMGSGGKRRNMSDGFDDEGVVTPTQPNKSKVRGALRSFGKNRYGRTTNRGNRHHDVAPAADMIDPTPTGLDPPASSGIYPDAVVNDDIESSLQDYYRSGLASHGNASSAGDPSVTGGSTLASSTVVTGAGVGSGRRTVQGSDVSVSSMESYGYSLDGYASSVAQSTQYGY